MPNPNAISVAEPAILAVLRGHQHAQDIARQVNTSMETSVTTMHWEGEANLAFQQSVNNWLEGLKKVRQALGVMESNMGQHKTATSNAEATNTGASNWYK